MPKRMKNRPNLHQRKDKEERISQDTINYYRRVSETLDDDFPDTENKSLFLDNVFRQLQSDIVKACHHAGTSRIIERLVNDASICNIITVFQACNKDWTGLLSDRIASHVLQSIITQIPRCICDNGESDTEDKRPELLELFSEFCDLLKENFDKYWTDTYGSHIVRVILQILGGAHVTDKVIRSRLSRNQKTKDTRSEMKFTDFKPTDSFLKTLTAFSKRIFKSEKLQAQLCNQTGNPVVQTLLLVWNKVDNTLCQKYIKKIYKLSELCTEEKDTDETKSLPHLVQDETGSFMVEQILNLGSEELIETLFKHLFKGRLLHFAIHPAANFILQRLLSNVKDKEHFEDIFEELCKHLEDILAVNHLGVVTHLAEACHRLRCKQEKLVRHLMEAFHCVEPVERQVKITPLIASLTTYDVFFDIGDDQEKNETDETQAIKAEKKIPLLTEINYHGSVLLQHLLRYGNPKLVVTSLLELKPVELKNLSCDPVGSHVIDTFCQSQSVGEKSREALFNRMKSVYFDVACSKNGSRTLEMMWKSATTKQKISIAEELSTHEHKLRSDQFGRFIYRNFSIGQFRVRRSEWMNLQAENQKKRKLFKDIFEDSGQTAKKQKTTKLQRKDTEDLDGTKLRLEEDEESEVSTQPISSVSKISVDHSEAKVTSPEGKIKNKKFKGKNGHNEYQIKDKKMKKFMERN